MSPFTTRPVIIGRHGVVTSGHYLATAAGFRIMTRAVTQLTLPLLCPLSKFT
ncbi:MAG: hypothetical protein CM1200mP35_10290 [Chloroflexota bacterium]|nr:MAG: hypothetical protein CM1200mP35_10290 [Chloroflexota bacterium]